VITSTQLRVGMLVLYNGKPHRVATVMHRTPGNLRGFVQAKLVNIESGSNQEVRFSTDDKMEKAVLDEHKLQFSYKSTDTYHFMNTESYEMIELSGEILGENAGYLIDGMMITAEYFQGRVVGIQPDHAQHQGRGGAEYVEAGHPRDGPGDQGPALHRGRRQGAPRYAHRRVRRARLGPRK
jgi:translation elongation factor P/translation initiation factor 5A